MILYILKQAKVYIFVLTFIVIRVRTHEAVEELPMGQQVQVDWGEIIIKNSENKDVKLYFITFVLSHSRYKYVEWLDRPFTTRDTIRCHEKAFQFFGECQRKSYMIKIIL
ncbi:DDE-type integrase/transposase/recombinase [Bacillus methanolicus]|uniref:DDE-type integrase/transposase/recombinase n=1 Tax=Bacillus methanolicus TaxID=1471 RepID=UPI00237FE80A|nr:DDE-type integrase/transposase/recombinase [Bacillus methanolicus]